jgi:hypothetical protein
MEECPIHKKRAGRRWLVCAALACAVIGAAVAVAYAAFQFTQGGCGMVRFYDHLVGALVIGTWFVGTALGLWLEWRGRRGRVQLLAVGFVIALASCAFMVVVGGTSVRALIEADYAYKSSDRLLQLLAAGNPDEKKMAAYEIGSRRLSAAVPVLSDYLADERTDVNLRLNAARALSLIGGENAETALASAFASCTDKEFCEALKFIVPRDAGRFAPQPDVK